jgi:hypothetical protein
METLASERAGASFNARELTYLLDGGAENTASKRNALFSRGSDAKLHWTFFFSPRRAARRCRRWWPRTPCSPRRIATS